MLSGKFKSNVAISSLWQVVKNSKIETIKIIECRNDMCVVDWNRLKNAKIPKTIG